MFKLVKEEGNNIMTEVEGTVDKEDYEKFLPTFESLVKKFGKINCVVNFNAVESITPAAVLEELKLSYKLRNNVGRYALINPNSSLNAIIEMARTLNKGEIKIFDKGKNEEAWRWIQDA